MADNYLEKQYEQYQVRKALWESKKKKGSKRSIANNHQSDSETLHELQVMIRENDRPYNPFRKYLYSPTSLYEGYQLGHPDSYNGCFDDKIYQHYLEYGKKTNKVEETLARSLHDHAISAALDDFLAQYNEKDVIGIMGGHGLLRTEEAFKKIALLSKRLTEAGFLMISGGGPGAMEATHLGAWMAGQSEEALADAIEMLSVAPHYQDKKWLDCAFQVISKYPQNSYQSLGIPTWLYGHEPSTPFATHIAKYFENAIREDGLLTIAMGGIIYSPGSAGTLQEIFQEAVQNHYLSFGYASPMIFMGETYWTDEMPIYPLLQHLLKKGKYKNLILSLTDSIDNIMQTFMKRRC